MADKLNPGIAAALADAYRVALIKAVKATCWRCREAPGIVAKHANGLWYHKYDGEQRQQCASSGIHDLLAAAPGGKS